MVMVEATNALAPYDTLRPMLCRGTMEDGRPCRRNLGELDWTRQGTHSRRCQRCKTANVVYISPTVTPASEAV